MGKKKKINGIPGVSDRGGSCRISGPDAWEADKFIAYWSEKIGAGFSPLELEQALKPALETNPYFVSNTAFQALEWFSTALPGKKRRLSETGKVAWTGLVDENRGRIFTAEACGGGLYCLDKETGRKIWNNDHDTLRSPRGMALFGNCLIVCDSWNNCVVAFSADDGAVLWQLDKAGGRNDGLSGPWDVTVVEREGTSEIWVCDRGNHRICRYDSRGSFIGRIGRRGLLAEEIAWRETKPAQMPQEIFFEFPQAIDNGTDSDGEECVFVWDSWNRRVVCLYPHGDLKRQFVLDRAGENESKFFSHFKTVPGSCGPLFLAIDDRELTLSLWNAEGEIQLKACLKADLFRKPGQAESIRIVPGSKSGAHSYLLTSSGLLVNLEESILDSLQLSEKMCLIRPVQANPALFLWECLKKSKEKSPVKSDLSWPSIFPGMSAGEVAGQMLNAADLFTFRLERNLARLDSLASDLARAGLRADSDNLCRAVEIRLDGLRAEAEKTLLEKARIREKDRELWSDVLTELDMVLFRTNGMNSSAEIHLDSILEQMKEHKAGVRMAAWKFLGLRRLAAKRALPETAGEFLTRLASHAAELLEYRSLELSRLESRVNFNEEPRHIHAVELNAMHAALLSVQSLELVTDTLAEEISRTLESRGAHGHETELAAKLSGCSFLAGGSGHWDQLFRRAVPSPGNFEPAAETSSGPGQNQESVRSERMENLKNLVAGMESYLSSLNTTNHTGNGFNKVLERLKEIFAVKASLLAARLTDNGDNSQSLTDLVEKAEQLAGQAWKKYKSLRKYNSVRS